MCVSPFVKWRGGGGAPERFSFILLGLRKEPNLFKRSSLSRIFRRTVFHVRWNFVILRWRTFFRKYDLATHTPMSSWIIVDRWWSFSFVGGHGFKMFRASSSIVLRLWNLEQYIYIYIYTQWLYFQSSGPRRDKILVLRGPQIVKFQHLEHADNFTNLLQNSLVTLQRTTEIYCETIRCKWSTCINKSRTWKINSEDMDLAITETQKKNRERYERIENNLMEIRTRRVRQKKEKMISYRHGSYLHLFSSHLSLSFITLDFVKL